MAPEEAPCTDTACEIASMPGECPTHNPSPAPDANVAPCCGRIPELVFGAWQPHDPREPCRSPEPIAAGVA